MSEETANANLQDFAGVPGEFVYTLGKIVVMAGRVEWHAIVLARAVGVENAHNLRFSDLAKRVKAHEARHPDVAAWCSDADAAMQRRNTLFHSYAVHTWKDDAWAPVSINIKRGEHTDQRGTEADDLLLQLQRLLKSADAMMWSKLPRTAEGHPFMLPW